jgi:hypothetical protein
MRKQDRSSGTAGIASQNRRRRNPESPIADSTADPSMRARSRPGGYSTTARRISHQRQLFVGQAIGNPSAR